MCIRDRFWLVLYGAGFLLTFVPEPWPTPDRYLARLRYVLMGQYSAAGLTNLVLGSAALSALAAAVGVVGFSRRDV